MPYPKNVIPTVYLRVGLPEDLHTKMTLFLYSELEQRVPKGSYQNFLSDLIRGFFGMRRLDLAPFAGVDAGSYIVTGSEASIALLKRTLNGAHK